jgi:hypothetical protein
MKAWKMEINRDVTMCSTAVMGTASEQRQIPSAPVCNDYKQNESTCIRYYQGACRDNNERSPMPNE